LTAPFITGNTQQWLCDPYLSGDAGMFLLRNGGIDFFYSFHLFASTSCDCARCIRPFEIWSLTRVPGV
ncbi:hypothetical protein ACRWAY_005245, partial [Escherichia coli]